MTGTGARRERGEHDRAALPLRGVLVGYGVIGQGHLTGYRAHRSFVVDVIVDNCAARREAARLEMPEARVYANLGEALDAEQLEFIDICTPPSSHLEFLLLALDNGMLALCEKPLLMRAADASALTAAISRSGGGSVYPCHSYCFAPPIQIMKETVGILGGCPTGGHFCIDRAAHARGVPEWNSDWRRDPCISGGGILRDHGPHAIYLAEYFMSAPVTAVACRLQQAISGPWASTEHSAYVDLYFEEVVIGVELSWDRSARNTSYRIESDGHSVNLDQHRLTINGRDVPLPSLLPSSSDDPIHGTWFRALLDDVLARRHDPGAMASLLSCALRTMHVIDRAYESATAGGVRLTVRGSEE